MADLRDTVLPDYQIVDGQDEVTYFRLQAEGDYPDSEVLTGFIRDEGLADNTADRNGVFLRQGETYWLLPRAVMNAFGSPPRLRDKFQEADGTAWLIEEVDARAGHTEYRCRCRKVQS